MVLFFLASVKAQEQLLLITRLQYKENTHNRFYVRERTVPVLPAESFYLDFCAGSVQVLVTMQDRE